MASTTLKNQRKRLTNDEKQKIIEDSKKPGFCRKKVMEKYGISQSAKRKLQMPFLSIL